MSATTVSIAKNAAPNAVPTTPKPNAAEIMRGKSANAAVIPPPPPEEKGSTASAEQAQAQILAVIMRHEQRAASKFLPIPAAKEGITPCARDSESIA